MHKCVDIVCTFSIIMVAEIDENAYLVPFVEDEEKYFLKTIYRSRKATKKYIKNKTEGNYEK